MSDTSLRITEIFRSLQGEAASVGWPTVFVRLTGCPLRCVYCDTAYAFHGGSQMSMDMVLETVAGFDTERVCVTGGEPLAQAACVGLLSSLCDAGHEVSLETGGALDIGGVDPRVTVVLDVKTPGSGEVARNLWSNIDLLKPFDQVKFVVCDRADYEWARGVVAERLTGHEGKVLFSPSWGEVDPGELADWILADRLKVRLQVQLHKYLWGDAPGR